VCHRAQRLGTVTVIATRPGASEGDTGTMAQNGCLVSHEDGSILATGNAHTTTRLQDITDVDQLTGMKQIQIEMDSGVTHMLRVAGYTYYNATDIDVYTDVGYTASLSGGEILLHPTEFNPDPASSNRRRMTPCHGQCRTAGKTTSINEQSTHIPN
jgi:hypothetical protein